MHHLVRIGLAIVVLAVPRLAEAQAPPDRALTSSPMTLGGYFGFAHNSPVGNHLGATPDRDHVFIGVHMTARLFGNHNWNVAYAPEVVPVLLVSDNPQYEPVVNIFGNEGFRFGTGSVYGFAMSPVGFELQRRLTAHLSVFGASAVGVVWFTRPTPSVHSRAFNYTAEWGGGMLWSLRQRYAVRAGYKFHHLSNAYSAPENPGLDGNVFQVGIQRSVGR